MLPQKKLTKEEKKELMLNKYVKREELDIEDIKKYGVFWHPAGSDVFSWVLICKCQTEQECLSEIKWRYNFNKTDKTDIALENDPRFSTFYDETKNKDSNGKTIEPTDADMVNPENISPGSLVESLPKPTGKFKTFSYYAGIELNYKGEFTILPVYEIE
jgi:hypothetical protein